MLRKRTTDDGDNNGDDGSDSIFSLLADKQEETLKYIQTRERYGRSRWLEHFSDSWFPLCPTLGIERLGKGDRRLQ